MKALFFRVFPGVLLVGSCFSILPILDLMVSLKYETSVKKCISDVTGRDLCFALKCWQIGAASAFLLFIGLSMLDDKTTKPKHKTG